MKILSLILAFSGLALPVVVSTAIAQPPDSLWSRMFGGPHSEICYSVQQTSDGGYILGGYTSSFGAGANDLWLVKTDANGDSLWSHTFGDQGNNECRSVLQTDDGGYALVGWKGVWHNGNYSDDFWLIRTDANGDSIWSRTIGGDAPEYAYSLQQTTDGDYIIGGMTYGGPNTFDMALMKVSSTGDSLWGRRYGGLNEERCYSVQQTTDGGYILAGYTLSFGHGNSDFWAVKTNAAGDSVWSHAYGGEGGEQCTSVRQTLDGGYVLAGITSSFGPDPGSLNFWLVRIDANGDTLWTRAYGGDGTDRCESLLLLPDGGFLLAGITPGVGLFDMWLVRVDANGNMLWNRTFSSSGHDYCYSVARTADGGYVLAGYTDMAGASNMWLVKTGPEGGGNQTTLLSEGFEGSFPPAGWQVQQLGPASENWRPLAGASGVGCGDNVHSGSNAVFHNDDMGTGELDVRDMLVTMEVAVPAGASEVSVSFFQRNCWVPEYYTDSTHHWVMSSINGEAWVLLAELDQQQDAWAETSLVIPEAAGQQLRIGFDYQGNYATEWYLDDVQVTARISQVADRDHSLLPTVAALLAPYPNPFNGVTRIPLVLPASARVDLAIYNILGQRVATLCDQAVLSAGKHTFLWECSSCATGMYLIRLQSGDRRDIRKLLLMR